MNRLRPIAGDKSVSVGPRTALVFSGGSLGAIQVGMLKALVNSDASPDFVAGSSVGAINAPDHGRGRGRPMSHTAPLFRVITYLQCH